MVSFISKLELNTVIESVADNNILNFSNNGLSFYKRNSAFLIRFLVFGLNFRNISELIFLKNIQEFFAIAFLNGLLNLCQIVEILQVKYERH